MWPKTHFTTLFEAQVIVMALSGMTVTAIAHLMHETDTRIWRLLGKAVAEARDAADYSDVVRVGIDDTARRRNQSYISIMANLDCQRAVAVTQGRDKLALGRLCAELKEHRRGPGEGLRGHARHGLRRTRWGAPRCPRPHRAWTASMWCSS